MIVGHRLALALREPLPTWRGSSTSAQAETLPTWRVDPIQEPDPAGNRTWILKCPHSVRAQTPNAPAMLKSGEISPLYATKTSTSVRARCAQSRFRQLREGM